MNTPLAEMFRYNNWATLTLIEACRSLSDEQLDAQVAGVSGTVRSLLMHVVGGQQSQALRTKGRHHEGEFMRHSEWPGFDVLIEAAGQPGEELIAIAEAGTMTATSTCRTWGRCIASRRASSSCTRWSTALNIAQR